ncbi:MAG: PIN domain nuclease [Actinomycetota bacterium]|nr:PIN domain nuclease [Actinomycetota bacterium]
MATHLIDKSAWVRLRHPEVLHRHSEALLAGRIASSGVLMLEVLVSARSAADFDDVRLNLSLMPRVAVTEALIDRALDVQGLMVRAGTHRAASPADLVLAACAEANGLTVLHYDKDFDLIAEVTGQPTEWIAPQGSLA